MSVLGVIQYKVYMNNENLPNKRSGISAHDDITHQRKCHIPNVNIYIYSVKSE